MNSTEQALRELGLIALGANPQQSPVMEEFQKCPEWQLAAALVSRALAHEHLRCQGRSKNRPQGRRESRPLHRVDGLHRCSTNTECLLEPVSRRSGFFPP